MKRRLPIAIPSSQTRQKHVSAASTKQTSRVQQKQWSKNEDERWQGLHFSAKRCEERLTILGYYCSELIQIGSTGRPTYSRYNVRSNGERWARRYARWPMLLCCCIRAPLHYRTTRRARCRPDQSKPSRRTFGGVTQSLPSSGTIIDSARSCSILLDVHTKDTQTGLPSRIPASFVCIASDKAIETETAEIADLHGQDGN